jgi:hypothetical protein
LRAAAFVSDEARERLCDRTPVPDCDGFGEVEGAPVFIAHYWCVHGLVLQRWLPGVKPLERGRTNATPA